MLNKGVQVLAVLTGLLITACAETPSPKFYVLESLSPPAAPVTDAAKKRSIGIGPVSIPSLLERRQIVTQTGHNSVDIAEFHQWAAPLKDNIIQVLQQNLAALLPHDRVRSYPWSAFGAVDRHVVIDITRFDASPGKSVNLDAGWAIMDEKSHQMIDSGQTKIEQPLTDTSYQATAKAFSQTLSELSRKLAWALNATVEKRE